LTGFTTEIKIEHTFNIGKETCLRWIKAYANKIKPKKYKNSRIEVIEMDELYTFISEKKNDFS
jgi:hypothetical protein